MYSILSATAGIYSWLNFNQRFKANQEFLTTENLKASQLIEQIKAIVIDKNA